MPQDTLDPFAVTEDPELPPEVLPAPIAPHPPWSDPSPASAPVEP